VRHLILAVATTDLFFFKFDGKFSVDIRLPYM
jgi:hypothetical protein